MKGRQACAGICYDIHMTQDRTRRRAVIVGYEYYARLLANLLNEHSKHWQARACGGGYTEKIRSILETAGADALISFGGPAPDGALMELARRRHIPVVVIWAGTDVLAAAKEPGLLEVIKEYGIVNVSDGEWLVDELHALGIEAAYVPVTAVRAAREPVALPETFRVLSHLPHPRRPFYGEDAVYRIARALPQVQFTIVGRGSPNAGAPPNVEFLGYVNRMSDLIDRCTALLRLPEHDGKSQLVLETLARGRHVVWTYEFPGVCAVRDIDGAIEALALLHDAHRRGALAVNEKGLAYVGRHFNPELLARNFETVLERAHAAFAVRPPARSRIVAISGFNLFSAQVARAVRESNLDWEPRILRTGRKSARLASLIQLIGADVWYSIGSPVPDRLLHAAARLLRKPRVVHWVGTDILNLGENAERTGERCDVGARHLTEVHWSRDELRAAGIAAGLAPLPPRTRAPRETPGLPRHFTALLYVPPSRGSFYGTAAYERLVATFARRPIRFLIVGGGTIRYPDNADVSVLGWRNDLDDLYERASVLVRFTEHDGLSLMALEALSYGRYVLWTQPFEHVTQVRSLEDCEHALGELLGAHLSGTLVPNEAAARFVKEQYDASQCIARIARAWEHASDGKPPAMRPAGASL